MTDKPKTRSKIQVKVRLPIATHTALTAVAAARGTSITAEMTRALQAYVDVMKAKEGACPST